MAKDSGDTKLGLDIGTNAIKILEVSGVPAGYSILAFGYKDIRETPKSGIAAAIKELAERSGVSSKETAVSVSGQSVIVRFITMPNMDDETLKNAIKFEAEKFIPFDINSCVIDYKILKKEAHDNKLNIVLVAAKKDAIMDKVKLAEEAGFQVRIVDIDSFAAANVFLKNFPNIGPDKTSALVNIGGSAANVGIIRNGAICFARDIPVGSNDFAAFVSKRMSVDLKTAGELIISPAEKSADVMECMRTIFTNLLEEVKLSFNYYENQDGRNIDEIYLSGGGMGLFGLNDMFEEHFGTKPLSWKPLEFLDKSRIAGGGESLQAFENSFAVAAGLSLR
jgi:type IV pilus assembly protein PilM